MALCWEPFTPSKLVISFSLCCCFLIQSFDHLTLLVFWQLNQRFCWGELSRIYFSTQNRLPQLELSCQLSYYQLTECKWVFSESWLHFSGFANYLPLLLYWSPYPLIPLIWPIWTPDLNSSSLDTFKISHRLSDTLATISLLPHFSNQGYHSTQ